MIRLGSTMIGLALLAFISSCGVAKYLPEGEYLYHGSQLTVFAPDSVNAKPIEDAGLELVNRPTSPKWRVWWHYQRGFLLGWLGKGLGREPVFFDPAMGRQLSRSLNTQAANEGYFWSLADYQLDTNARARTIGIDYELQVGAAFKIDSLQYAIRESTLAQEIQDLSAESLLRTGERYSLAKLRAERQRLESELRERGYYFFSGQQLEFLADTIGNQQGVILLMKLTDAITERSLCPQRIRRVIVRSEFERQLVSRSASDDTISHNGLEIVCKECQIRAELLAEAIAYRPGDRYQLSQHERSVQRLAELNMYRYISLNYTEVASGDSLLDLVVYLTPDFRRTISGELGLAYNSGRYFGPELGFTYTNRNLLGGAELFTLEGDFAYNFYLGDERFSRIPRSGVYGLGAELSLPRLWLPWKGSTDDGLLRRTTDIRVGTRLEALSLNLNRFTENIAAEQLSELAEQLTADSNATANLSVYQIGASFGYQWQKIRPVKHQIFPLNLTYQNPRAASEELLELSRSLGISQGLEGLGRLDRMLSFGPSYGFQYDSRKAKRASPHQFFTSANLNLRFNRVLPIGDNQRGLAAENSQYIQPELDLRYYCTFSSQWQLASRIHTGIAIPFSDRAIVPYFDLYTIGGPNSLRGFIPRGLGPGRTAPLENSLLGQNGYGNVLFETQLELRFRPIPMVELAIFGDAGNVWLFKAEAEPTPGDFDFARFRQELATDAGIGIRFDLDFLLIRIDIAKPIRIPSEVNEATPPNKDPRFVLAFGQAF